APVPVGAESVAVDVPLLNVRSGPGLQFPIVGVVSQGQLLDIHGDAPGWYYVQGPSGSFGWVIDNLTRPVPAG
ncbi:MAG: SH3 domain-containing protein, partial [Desulfuromonadales bacterium]